VGASIETLPMSAPSSSSQLLALLRTRGVSSTSIPILLMADCGTKTVVLVNHRSAILFSLLISIAIRGISGFR
jgi:hypothetical protein